MVWPYVALEMLYDINLNNAVNGFVELGLPSYTATADQPYRYDWQHPKSIEDKAGIGSAFHLGMGANWTTMITKSVALSIGVTYDYYTVSEADATTFMNPEYWTDIKDAIIADGINKGYTEEQILDPKTGDATAVWITDLEANGWKEEAKGEIESFYKSLGVRIGINARF